jgi:hypothetical protein
VDVGAASVVIRDTGVGIAPGQVDAMYQPFVRGDAGRRGGHGVGLTIVRRLSDRFGWPVSDRQQPRRRHPRRDPLSRGAQRADSHLIGLVTANEPSVRVVGRKVTPLNLEMLARTEELEEIVVVARALIADPHGAVSNSLLNREELRSAPGTGSDVLRALDGLPGLISDGEFASFSVRGRGPRDNLILIDDFPLTV